MITKDGWKIVQPGKENGWELYNLNEDRTELSNVSDKYPKQVSKMKKQYDEWAKRCMVIPAPN